MPAEHYRFKVGAFNCVAVLDGSPMYSPQSIFANVEPEILKKALEDSGLPSQEIGFPYICLALNSGEGWVLLDTGLGAGNSEDAGRLIENLQAAEIAPEEVNTVIFTHAHADHIGGNTDSQGKPAFPKAKYIMHKPEWDFWTTKENLVKIGSEDMMPFVNKNLGHIQDKFEFFEGETEVVPGITAIPASGHTPGHVWLDISSEGDRLLNIGDTIAHALHLQHPDWHMVFDISPQEAIATRRKFSTQAAADGTLVFAYHLPFPGLGHVVEDGESWEWQPIKS